MASRRVAPQGYRNVSPTKELTYRSLNFSVTVLTVRVWPVFHYEMRPPWTLSPTRGQRGSPTTQWSMDWTSYATPIHFGATIEFGPTPVCSGGASKVLSPKASWIMSCGDAFGNSTTLAEIHLKPYVSLCVTITTGSLCSFLFETVPCRSQME